MHDSKMRKAFFALSSVVVLLMPIARFAPLLFFKGHVKRTASVIGRIPWIGSLFQLSNPAWNPNCHDLFPLTAIFAIALAVWSLHLYRRVGNPYLFELTPHSERKAV